MEGIGYFKLLIALVLLGQVDLARGHNKDAFPSRTKYIRDVENYIMEGYGRGWKHCDVIHDISMHHQTNFFDGTPTYVMDINQLPSLDIQKTFSSSFDMRQRIGQKKRLSSDLRKRIGQKKRENFQDSEVINQNIK